MLPHGWVASQLQGYRPRPHYYVRFPWVEREIIWIKVSCLKAHELSLRASSLSELYARVFFSPTRFARTLGTRGFFSLTSDQIGRRPSSLTSDQIGRRPSRVGRRPTQRAACRAGHNREHKTQPETAQEKPLAPGVLRSERASKSRAPPPSYSHE